MKQISDPDDDGLAEYGAAGGIDRIANSYFCAFHLARVGWDLLHRRSAADGSGEASSTDWPKGWPWCPSGEENAGPDIGPAALGST